MQLIKYNLEGPCILQNNFSVLLSLGNAQLNQEWWSVQNNAKTQSKAELKLGCVSLNWKTVLIFFFLCLLWLGYEIVIIFLCLQEHQQVHTFWPLFQTELRILPACTTYVLGNPSDKCVMIRILKLGMERHKTKIYICYQPRQQ